MIEYINEEETIGKILKNIKQKLTLQEARQQYRNKNKKCEYCEFCSREKSFEDFAQIMRFQREGYASRRQIGVPFSENAFSYSVSVSQP